MFSFLPDPINSVVLTRDAGGKQIGRGEFHTGRHNKK
jgi:hypothetical protein